ncbi:hypothetical protein MYX77_08740 [Acidobacteriia bacterium AH_259_A11_L15]|nr:hypothetical protein [Acidobacteriia bacterium AH_259_A11_L15]
MESEKDRLIAKIKEVNRWGPEARIVQDVTSNLDQIIAAGEDAEFQIGWGLTNDGHAYRLRWSNQRFSFERLSPEEAAQQGFEEMSMHVERKTRVPAAEAFTATARLWPFQTLCEFPDPPNWPSAWEGTGAHVSYTTFQSCEKLQETLGDSVAVLVTLANNADSDLRVPIEGLNAVALSTRDGKKLPALACHLGGIGKPFYKQVNDFATKMVGTFVVIVPAGKEADLIFLFVQADPGDSVSVGNLSVKIAR